MWAYQTANANEHRPTQADFIFLCSLALSLSFRGCFVFFVLLFLILSLHFTDWLAGWMVG